MFEVDSCIDKISCTSDCALHACLMHVSCTIEFFTVRSNCGVRPKDRNSISAFDL